MEGSHLRLSDLYLWADEELRRLQEELKQLEEAALKIAPFFERLENRLDALQQKITDERSPVLARRLATLRFQLKTLARRHGYSPEIFANLEQSLRRARRKAPREIVPPRLLQRLKHFDRSAALPRQQNIHTRAAKLKSAPADSLYFYMLQNGTMKFLLPGETILWRRRVPNRKQLRLQLRKEIAPEPVLFSELPGEDILQPPPVQKLAVFSAGRIGRFAVLVDNVLGSIRLTPQLFRQKLNFMKVKDTRYEAYLLLHGERFFIRKKWLEALQSHLQQSSANL